MKSQATSSTSLSLFDRYYWRTPYTNMTETEIVAHLQAARDFAYSDANPIDCIGSALMGESAACCLSWAGTKLEPDYIFAGVDDTEGTIKVMLHSSFVRSTKLLC